MTPPDPPPLTVVRPGEGPIGNLGAGGYITKPRGQYHAMWNAGSAPARMIEIISPAGFEHFLREVSELANDLETAAARGPALADRYGLRFAEPDWLASVIERYGLGTT